MTDRVCSVCRDPWPLECFARDPASPGGRERRCLACRAERRRELAAGASRRRPWGTRIVFKGSDRERARDRARKARV